MNGRTLLTALDRVDPEGAVQVVLWLDAACIRCRCGRYCVKVIRADPETRGGDPLPHESPMVSPGDHRSYAGQFRSGWVRSGNRFRRSFGARRATIGLEPA